MDLSRRPLRARFDPVLVPALVAVAYLVVLIVHYPAWITAQNGSSDIDRRSR